MTDTLHLPFSQHLYDSKTHVICIVLTEPEHRSIMDSIRDGDYPHTVVLTSEHTGNMKMFTFAGTNHHWINDNDGDISITIKYTHDKMDVELIIIVDK